MSAQMGFGAARTAWRYLQRQVRPGLPIQRSLSSRSFGKGLPSARAVWQYGRGDVDIAWTNNVLRKGPVTKKEIDQLEELRTPYAAATQRKTLLSQEINEITKRIAEAKHLKKDEHSTPAAGGELQEQARNLRLEIKKEDDSLKQIHAAIGNILLRLPNYTHPQVPIGGAEKAIVIGKGGDSTLLPSQMRINFEKMSTPISLEEVSALLPARQADKEKDHFDMAIARGWMDVRAGQTVSGPRWPILSGPLAILEHALVRYGMERACDANFKPVVVPDVIKEDILSRTGFSPREGSGGQVFWVRPDGEKAAKNGRPGEDLALAGTAEIPLAASCANTTYKQDSPAQQLVATSHAFRAEAGARGRESRGLYRVHQFTKVEMFVVCRPDESEAWLERIRSIQEDIVLGLGIPYRVLDMPTEELGSSACRKYDIEAWMPGRGRWGEISSASNCTEYQARRLFIRYTVADRAQPSNGGAGGGLAWAHTLNGTAVAVPRLMVALLENYGTNAEGKMRLPIALKRHWIGSAQDQVEWLGSEREKSSKALSMQNAVNRVRGMAARNGTDTASMVLSFFILHELTAIVPLVLLFYLLGLLGVGEQVMKWLMAVSEEDDAGARSWLRRKIDEGMKRWERYGRRKGYFGFEAGSKADEETASSSSALVGTFANIVAAYAITKALFPLRIGASVLLAGPFARLCIEPVKRVVARRAMVAKK